MSEDRKLVTIERIEKLEPIDGADFIVKATGFLSVSVNSGLVHFSPYGSERSSCGKMKYREGPDFTDERARTSCQDCRAHFKNPSDAERQRGHNE